MTVFDTQLALSLCSELVTAARPDAESIAQEFGATFVGFSYSSVPRRWLRMLLYYPRDVLSGGLVERMLSSPPTGWSGAAPPLDDDVLGSVAQVNIEGFLALAPDGRPRNLWCSSTPRRVRGLQPHPALPRALAYMALWHTPLMERLTGSWMGEMLLRLVRVEAPLFLVTGFRQGLVRMQFGVDPAVESPADEVGEPA